MSKKPLPLYNISCLDDETKTILLYAKAVSRARGSFSVTLNDLFLSIPYMPTTDVAQAFEQCGIILKQVVLEKHQLAPLTTVGYDPAYTPLVQSALTRSIHCAKERGRDYVLPSDLLHAMLELLKGNEEEVDVVFFENAERIHHAIQTIKNEKTRGLCG